MTGSIFTIDCQRTDRNSGPPSVSNEQTQSASGTTPSSGADNDGQPKEPSHFKLKLILSKQVRCQKNGIDINDDEKIDSDSVVKYILFPVNGGIMELYGPDDKMETKYVKFPADITIKGYNNPHFILPGHEVDVSLEREEKSLTMTFGGKVRYTSTWNTATHIDLPLSIENNCCENRAYLHFPNMK